MPKFRIKTEYRTTVWYRSTVEIEAASEAEARAAVRRLDEDGNLNFYDYAEDSSLTNVEVVAVEPEEQALADMTAAYLGEASP